MKMILKLIQAWMAWVLPRPRLVLGLAVVTALASFTFAAMKLDVETDQLELISTDHPLIELTDKLDPYNFEGKRTLTVVIEAPNPERGLQFLQALAPRIKEDTRHFEDVFYRVDPSLFKQWAFLYLDREDLVQLRDQVEEHYALINGLAAEPTLYTFLNQVNQEMANRMVGELFTGFLDEPDTAEGSDNGKQPMDLSFLTGTLAGLSSYLKGAPEYVSPWSSFFKEGSWDMEKEGYFWEGKKRFLIMSVVAKKTKGSFSKVQDSLEHLRRLIRETQALYPDVQAGVTGQEALNNDEMDTVLGDMARATWLSLLGVLVLMVVFLRSFRRPLVEMVSLGIGLCWTFGWTTLFIGHLNILSVVFAPLLCGLGVDYGIHWFSRFEEEERTPLLDQRSVIRRVMECSGPGILLAGFSAALSFIPFVLTGFRGLIELGLITGMGTLLILFADFTVLPALSVFMAGRRKAASTPEVVADDGKNLLHLGPRTARLILACVAVVSVLSISSATRVHFDLNPLRLQATNAEAVVWEKRLVENSDRSLLSVAVFAHSQAEVEAKSRALEALPTVSEVESVYTLLPEHQDEKLVLLKSILPRMPEIQSTGASVQPFEIKRLGDVLERIRFKMQEDQASEWGAQKPIVDQMNRVRTLAGEILHALPNSPEAVQRLTEYQNRFRQDLIDTWDFVREAAAASPMSIQDLPAELRDKFHQNNEYLIRIYPRESIWEQGALNRFVQSVQQVDPLVVGDPVSLYVFSSAYKRACILASIYAITAIFVLLIVTFRNLWLALLALVPLVVGTLWTVGIMGMVGISFNLANSIFMPLVVGAGVEYGVIILHRWREGTVLPGDLPLSTGKGVILAALTTTAGFGTLMISHHRGIFSLGFVAGIGSLCVLAAAIVILPALLASVAQPKTLPNEEI